MDSTSEGHGRIGRAFCSAHFREVPILLRVTGPATGLGGASPAGSVVDASPAGSSAVGTSPAGSSPGGYPVEGSAPPTRAAPPRRFIDAMRAEAERTFYPRESGVAGDRVADPTPPPEPAPLPPNADMIAEGVEAVTCLDYGVRCTGWLCPLFALPTVPPEDLLAEAMAAERRRWRRRDAGSRRRAVSPEAPTPPTPPTSATRATPRKAPTSPPPATPRKAPTPATPQTSAIPATPPDAPNPPTSPPPATTAEAPTPSDSADPMPLAPPNPPTPSDPADPTPPTTPPSHTS